MHLHQFFRFKYQASDSRFNCRKIKNRWNSNSTFRPTFLQNHPLKVVFYQSTSHKIFSTSRRVLSKKFQAILIFQQKLLWPNFSKTSLSVWSTSIIKSSFLQNDHSRPFRNCLNQQLPAVQNFFQRQCLWRLSFHENFLFGLIRPKSGKNYFSRNSNPLRLQNYRLFFSNHCVSQGFCEHHNFFIGPTLFLISGTANLVRRNCQCLHTLMNCLDKKTRLFSKLSHQYLLSWSLARYFSLQNVAQWHFFRQFPCFADFWTDGAKMWKWSNFPQ